MLETKDHFHRRLLGLGRKHKAMANGYTTQLRADGLIVVKPRRPRRGVPVKGLFLTAMGFVAFKAFAVISMGDVLYTERVDTLRQGTIAEQAGAWAMQIDPATAALVKAYADITG